MQEEFFVLSHKPFKKIKVPKVLSWDLTGHPDQNIVSIGTEERRFELLDYKQGRKNDQNCPASTRPHKEFKYICIFLSSCSSIILLVQPKLYEGYPFIDEFIIYAFSDITPLNTFLYMRFRIYPSTTNPIIFRTGNN